MSDKRFELSRRNALIGLGTVGAASAGAGLGTSAYFSDEESFEDNTLEAGELDLFVDYWTDANSEAIAGGTTGSGQNDGGVSAQYVLNDVKPGDSGKLVFCPKVVDNPAWLWAGSTGFTQYENGLTEPEEDVDGTGGNPGEGNGELADNIQVTVAYCEPADGLDGEPQSPDDFETVRELNNPDDYTLADLLVELQTGYLLDGYEEDDGDWVPTDDGAYPASPDSETQTGPCLCIDWNVPTTVGNVIQSDSVEFDIGFTAQQSRHNANPENPFSQTFTIDQAFSGVDSQNGDFSDPISLPYDGLGEEQEMVVTLRTDPVVILINTAKSLVGGQYPDNFGLAFETTGDNTGDFQVMFTEGTGFEYEDPVASGSTGPLPSEISATQISGDQYVIEIDRSKLASTFSVGGKVGYASETPPSGSGNVVVNLTPEFWFGPSFTESDAYSEITLE
ncbi:SipW-dependent-type signal peptide-containing protein [Halorubrum sp. F4]|uniref:SipW-dependent-type signal peptide-containing protein n=1 Tax=Halorubrum sp. F4 TaxID=2989715 RepID=UPI002480B072|nr:SipW-dependent-type signal peptide-containing protein [Halorubrum sp. F4]